MTNLILPLVVFATLFAAPPSGATHTGANVGDVGSRSGSTTGSAGLTPARDASDGLELRDAPSANATRYRGTATFYCSDGRDGSPVSDCTAGYGPDDLVAAIDPKIGFGKGDFVRVRYAVGEDEYREVTVRIVDVCACRGPRVIDLTIGAFQRLAPWGMGVLPVRLELARAPRTTLPATDA